jgi:hypothetical protein
MKAYGGVDQIQYEFIETVLLHAFRTSGFMKPHKTKTLGFSQQRCRHFNDCSAPWRQIIARTAFTKTLNRNFHNRDVLSQKFGCTTLPDRFAIKPKTV